MIYAGFDWIVPIIFIIVALIQVFTKGKKIANGQGTPPEKIGDEWKDLLEALGKKAEQDARPTSPPPIIQEPPIVVVPPSPKPAIKPAVKPAAKKIVVEQEPDEFAGRHIVEMPSEAADAATARHQKPQLSAVPIVESLGSKKNAQRKANIFTALKDRQTIRNAVLLNEILSPPLALRT